MFDRGDEDLAVADLAGTRGFDDGVDGRLDLVVGDDNLDLDLRQKVDDVLGAAIELGMPLLAPEPLDLGDGEAGHADLGQGLADLVELKRLHDCFDFLHAWPPDGSIVTPWK